jgi:hypothetical protein
MKSDDELIRIVGVSQRQHSLHQIS